MTVLQVICDQDQVRGPLNDLAILTESISVRILFGLTGPPGCGKDAAADHLAEAHGFARVAFADPIRQAALILDPYIPGAGRLSDVVHQYGWTTAKTRWPEVRRILQLLGTELGRQLHGEDVWITKTFARIGVMPLDQSVVVTDCRFPNEAQAIREHGGLVVRINRSTTAPDAVMDHASERESAGLLPDYVLPNHSSLDELHRRLDRLVARTLKRRRHC